LIVIFNGPPGSGKDAGASYFKRNYSFKHLSFKHVLFRETVAHYGVDLDWFLHQYDDREVKERKEAALGGLSRREALINVSENIVKPQKGSDYYGRCVAAEVQDGRNYSISGGGFAEELIPLINRVGTDNIVLVQLARDGCDYSSDSRRYLNGRLVREFTIVKQTQISNDHILPHKFDVDTYRIHNNGNLEQFHRVLQQLYEKECNEKAKGHSVDVL
jgi:hypothetical protein